MGKELTLTVMRSIYNIRINLRERRLYLYQGNTLYNAYPVAIGKPSTPSPVGNWKIVNKAVLAGGTVYGTRWMGLNIDNYGIHGNNNPASIGKAVSLGCIRMFNEDIEQIFSIVPVGTAVRIEAGTANSGYPLPPYNSGSSGTAPGNRIYVIKAGDTLWSIAQKHGVSMEALLQANPRLNPDLIYPGHIVYIPCGLP